MKYIACESCADGRGEKNKEDETYDLPDALPNIKWRYKSFGADGVAICDHLNRLAPLHRVIVFMKPSNTGTRAYDDKYYVGQGPDPRKS